MKKLLLTTMFAFYTFFGFSQAYKLDERKTYYKNDSAENGWKQDQTQIYSYLNGGIKETKISITDFSTSEKYYQVEKYYNANNDISLIINQEEGQNPGEWTIFSEVKYDYDTSNRLINETTRLYDNTTMTYINESRLLYDYPGASRLKRSSTSQEWNASKNDWINDEKDEMYYINGLLDAQISSYWNALTSEWLLRYRDMLKYDKNNLLIERKYESYSDGKWVLDDRDLATYSGTLLIEVLSQSWIDSGWRNDLRYVYTYDNHGNAIEFYYEQRGNNTLEMVPHYKEEMTYSLAEPLLSKNEFIVGDFKLYPNPVKDVINLDFDSSLSTNYEVQVFGMDGKLIQTQKLTTGIQKFQLHLENLQKGMYLLKFKGNQNLTYKILKE